MYNDRSSMGSRRVPKQLPKYVPNEVVISTVKGARNDDLPHYLSVAAGAVEPETVFGDSAVDKVFESLDLPVRSISRVYIPRSDVPASVASGGLSRLLSSGVSAAYDDEEDSRCLSRTYRVTFDELLDVRKVCRKLQKSKAVKYATPNFLSQVKQVAPNDAFYHLQWGLQAINAEEGWGISSGADSDVLIAVVDSGVDLQHDDLSSKLELVPGLDFVDFQGPEEWWFELTGDYEIRDDHPQDEDGHGTHCAGIAASQSNNGEGTAGVCWGGRILPIRVMFRVFDFIEQRYTSLGTNVDIDAGITFAANAGAHVINLSLGGENPSHENADAPRTAEPE